ncbi:sensor histidine kinase [Cellulomonas aerilata]|uniref:histidine kinase n=1 Tax=Cellulomonas aerilata TaxID=515326 RepID=A0A512DH58_9CELL|nr:histidine kinase [Cellulomonas aerilata]GEO35817.1 two-component sensor histidine kinase [Cellulomonas aerilata]
MGWWERWNRWLESRAHTLDTLATVVLAFVSVLVTVVISAIGGWTAVAWSVLVVAPLAWRRRRPVASAVAVYAAGLAHTVLGLPLLVPADLAVLIALYSVTVYGPRWAHRTAIATGLVGCAVLGVALMVVDTAYGVGGGAGVTVFTGMAALVVWASGLVKRSRRETLLVWQDRAERLRVERDQQAQIATAAERARIAREMHDIVAHSLSVVIAQADGGRYAAQADPAAAARSLGTIAETGRAALADMRRLLGVLRDGSDDRDGGPGAPATPALVPQPDAGDVEQLVDQVRATGVRVSLVRMGTPRTLPPGAGLTVFRICQESLTNVLKHAGPDPTVTVLVQWTPSDLVLEVSDDGRGAAAIDDGAGNGVLGMRERAAMFGGTLTAGPRAGGGYRVRAQLPLPAGT